jgi:hypothetical protein
MMCVRVVRVSVFKNVFTSPKDSHSLCTPGPQRNARLTPSLICSCRNKIGAELNIYLEEGTYHKRLFRGPDTNDITRLRLANPRV